MTCKATSRTFSLGYLHENVFVNCNRIGNEDRDVNTEGSSDLASKKYELDKDSTPIRREILKELTNCSFSFPRYLNGVVDFVPTFCSYRCDEREASTLKYDTSKFHPHDGYEPKFKTVHQQQDSPFSLVQLSAAENSILKDQSEPSLENRKWQDVKDADDSDHKFLVSDGTKPDKNDRNEIMKSKYLKKVPNQEIITYNIEDEKFKIITEKIINGQDKRTTCMIKNIPNKFTVNRLLDLLNEHHYGTFDFLYLRMDFQNNCNVGYAFVNFTSSIHVLTFYRKIHGMGWKNYTSTKIAALTYASIQGIAALKSKFRKSTVLSEQESYRPKIFYTEGKLRGYEKPGFDL